jgi:hypothetical protein
LMHTTFRCRSWNAIPKDSWSKRSNLSCKRATLVAAESINIRQRNDGAGGCG